MEYDYDTGNSKTPALDYIWGSDAMPTGQVVSGGDSADRVKALLPFVYKSQKEGIPLIALHTGNRDLTAMLGANSVAAEYIERGQAYYDVFRGMPVDDIAYLLYETMPAGESSPWSPPAKPAVRSVTDWKKAARIF